MMIACPTPAAWLEGPQREFFGDPEPADYVELSLAALLADDAAALRAVHALVMARGTPAPAAATYLAGWYGGIAGSAVGFTYAAADAGLLVARGGLTWTVHPEGWCAGLKVTALEGVAVPAGHRWIGSQPGVAVVADPGRRAAATTQALVRALEPLITALTGMAKVKPVNLWYEVADRTATALTYQSLVRVTPAGVGAIELLLRAEGAPWRRLPHIERVATAYGDACLVHRSGCCLAYTEPVKEEDEDDHEADDEHRLYRSLFPEPADAPRYCTNCRLRDRKDSFVRQLWWRERELRERSLAGEATS